MNALAKQWFGWAFYALTIVLVLGCSSKPTDADIDEDEPEDLTSPATVTDLRVVSPTPTALTLAWTAPGDDGSDGFAVSYDLRGAQEPITEDSFASAVRIDLDDPPLPPGETEDVIIEPLEQGQTYYFALKAYDDAGNVSAMSNCACGTCLIEQTINIPDANLEQLLRETLNVPTGDIHLSDMLQLTELAGNGRDIAVVTGLEVAVNLRIVNATPILPTSAKVKIPTP